MALQSGREDIVRDATPRMPRLAEVCLFLVLSSPAQAGSTGYKKCVRGGTES